MMRFLLALLVFTTGAANAFLGPRAYEANGDTLADWIKSITINGATASNTNGNVTWTITGGSGTVTSVNNGDTFMEVTNGTSAAIVTFNNGLVLEVANNLADVDNATTARSNLGLEIGVDVQAYSSVLANTTASFTTADETKLDGVEALADVTDATNVNAAGAVMESDYTLAHSLLVQQSGTGSPSSLSVSNNSFVGKITGDIVSLTASQARTILDLASLYQPLVDNLTTLSTNNGAALTNIDSTDITRGANIVVFEATTDTATGDGKAYLVIPSFLNGMNLTRVHARVNTAGTIGTTDIQIHNVTDAVDMLSTKLTIDSGETGSDTAATPAVINTSNDDVATNDLLRVDLDSVSTIAAQGLIIILEFQLP